MVIVKVFDSTPAHKAGLSQGDVIITVDGINVKEKPLEEVAALIKGEVGTKVVLGVMKAGSRTVTIIEVVREKIRINPVAYEIREGDIGYIKIETFNSNADEFVNEALKYLDSKGITKVILDLRNNPGGEVIQAVNIAKKFVPRSHYHPGFQVRKDGGCGVLFRLGRGKIRPGSVGEREYRKRFGNPGRRGPGYRCGNSCGHQHVRRPLSRT